MIIEEAQILLEGYNIQIAFNKLLKLYAIFFDDCVDYIHQDEFERLDLKGFSELIAKRLAHYVILHNDDGEIVKH